MVHYKVHQTAHPALDKHFFSLCGVNTAISSDDEFSHIPPCEIADCGKLVVDCPKCLAIVEVLKREGLA